MVGKRDIPSLYNVGTKVLFYIKGLFMIYYTGDLHGLKAGLIQFCNQMDLTSDDTIILLGDVGANYYGGSRDRKFKHALNRLNIPILCIHGNHEMRPSSIPSYKTKEWNGGTVWYEEDYPNLLFAKDGEIFTIDWLRRFVIGGAYSVDKYYRLMRGYGWWPDEQPSAEIKVYVEDQVKKNPHIDVVLSHTCPYKYEPVEAFLPMIDESTVDKTTEYWLDKIEGSIDYQASFWCKDYQGRGSHCG